MLNARAIPVAGFDLNHTDYSNNAKSRRNEGSYGYQANAVLAHVTQKWVYGISVQSLRWKSFALANSVIGKHDFAEIFVGRCFSVPGWLKKPLNKINRIFELGKGESTEDAFVKTRQTAAWVK